MKKVNLFVSLLFLFTALSAETSGQSVNKPDPQEYQLAVPYTVDKIESKESGKLPKNIILMIGDGMSLMDVYTAWTANRGHLFMENCNVTGLSKTYSASNLITDSGAGGTAIATGHKTLNNRVGLDAEGNPVKSILKIAQENNKSTGLVVTTSLLDATPADFIAHNMDRRDYAGIANDYVKSGVDFIFGSGRKEFLKRKDGRNIFDEMRKEGYQLPESMDELNKLKGGRIFSVMEDHILPPPEKRGDQLAAASRKAIELLSRNKEGFFLMIEGSLIDYYAHANDLSKVMEELFDFDKTVGEVLKWAAADGETLVIVTADHETGGLTLIDGNLSEGRVVCRFSTGVHSGVMVPVFAFGPKAELFTGIFENTAIFDKMMEAYGFKK